MRSGWKPTSRFDAVTERQPGLDEVEVAVTGMRPGGHYPFSEPFAVHDGEHGAAPPPRSRDDVRHESESSAVDDDGSDVDHRAEDVVVVLKASTVATPAERATKVAAGQPDLRHGKVVVPRARSMRRLASRSLAATTASPGILPSSPQSSLRRTLMVPAPKERPCRSRRSPPRWPRHRVRARLLPRGPCVTLPVTAQCRRAGAGRR